MVETKGHLDRALAVEEAVVTLLVAVVVVVESA